MWLTLERDMLFDVIIRCITHVIIIKIIGNWIFFSRERKAQFREPIQLSHLRTHLRQLDMTYVIASLAYIYHTTKMYI